jgi:hypothetical protein
LLALLTGERASNMHGQVKETVVHDDDYGPWDD